MNTSKKYKTMNFFKRGVLVIGMLSALSACKKNEWLNPQPSTLITDETAFSTPERIQSQVNGVYSQLKTSRFLGSWYYIVSDIRAGDFLSSNLNAANGATSYLLQTQTTTNDVVNIWEQGYQAINASNVFIDGMNTYGMEVVGEEQGTIYIAEARLVRALAYYYLLQLYARPYWDGNGSKPGLPLRLEGNKEPGNYDLARSSVAETYAQIIADLDFAEANLPDSYSSAFLNTTRAHKNTAIALKVRAYMSMGDYDKVIEEAGKIVSETAPFTALTGVKHALSPSVRAVFDPPYTTTESIFSMPFTSNDAPGTSIAGYFLPGTQDGGTTVYSGSGDYSLYADGIPASTNWKATDDRRAFLLTGPTSGKLWLFKLRQASPHTDYVPVIRYAEILLSLSEAITRSTGAVSEKAVTLLNAVRHRSDKSTTFTVSDFPDKDSLLEQLITERQIEFLGEGIRNSDIMRLGLDIPAKPAHSVRASKPTDENYIFPISNDELTLNGLMENN